MKQLIAALASAAAIALIPAPTAAALETTQQIAGVTYTATLDRENGTATITAVSGATGRVSVPDEIDGCSVTAVGDKAFFGQTGLSGAELPDTVKSIGRSAFAGCTSMNQFAIPNTVTDIGYGAFMSCTDLAVVSVGDGVSEIPDDCFYSCPSLADVRLPDGLKKIGAEAFFGCPSVTAVIPESVSEIGENAFGMQADPHSDEIVKVYGFLIVGTKGSYAEEFAASNGIDFFDPDNFLAGDINNDQKVDATDASAVLSEYARASTGAALTFTKWQRIVGDMTRDAAIDATDASKILIEYARLSTQ